MTEPRSNGSRSPAVDRVVILARGLGRRMRRAGIDSSLRPDQRAAADGGSKAMMPIAARGEDSKAAGRTLLDYSLSRLADAGYRHACLVIGPEHDAVREHYRENPTRRISVQFAVQEEPLGTADAVASAEDFIGSHEFTVINGDNLYPVAALAALRALDRPGLIGFESKALVAHGNIAAERVLAFALLDADETGLLERVIEKPTPEQATALGTNPLVSMNCWRLPPAIVPACRRISVSERGEFELPDAVEAIMARGESLQVVRSNEGVLDLSERGDVAEVSRILAGERVDP